MTEYILYKEPVSLDTLNIVQYLHAHGIHLVPKFIIERNHGVAELPTIVCQNVIYSGLSKVVEFYEDKSGIKDLLGKSREWKTCNPNYRINN
jgi:hypothetical protein